MQHTANGYTISVRHKVGAKNLSDVFINGPSDFRLNLLFHSERSAQNTYEILVGQIDRNSGFDVGRGDAEDGNMKPIFPDLMVVD